ncbi:MAG: AmmeMemoRadiSam system protein B [Desulfobulbaceae bacterium]|jgi:AmmeMemoRadiSam system protein B|nr:AmmeMemoRadiSam system protein B [Desulfobulbaceae bacterium]
MQQDQYRTPAWAGSFYPADKESLANQIEAFACETTVSQGRLRGMIMPHAGYIYSGYTAAQARKDVQQTRPKHIILLGPDHHVGMSTSHITHKEYWQSPLGSVPVSKNSARLLDQHPQLFQHNSLSDAKEHSLEVIVPFLQAWLEKFDLLPIVIGQVDPEQLAQALTPYITAETLLVVSSDLSHFLSDDEARAKDENTLAAILDMNLAELAMNTNNACGLTPICTLLNLAQKFSWQPRLLHYSTSGDTSGDYSRVVGYAAIGFYEQE